MASLCAMRDSEEGVGEGIVAETEEEDMPENGNA